MPLPRPFTVTLAAAATLALGSLSGCSTLPDAVAGDHAAHHADGRPGTATVAAARGMVRTCRDAANIDNSLSMSRSTRSVDFE
jgi:hypothetical protein